MSIHAALHLQCLTAVHIDTRCIDGSFWLTSGLGRLSVHSTAAENGGARAEEERSAAVLEQKTASHVEVSEQGERA